MRWIVTLAVAALSLTSCGSCPKLACARTIMVAVRDETGSALTDFTATLAGPPAISVTCPGGSGCSGSSVALRPEDGSSMQRLSVTAGAKSGSVTFTPQFESVQQISGCPGCPVASVDITVR